ncbi:Protein DBF4 like protein [Argiope bruennichi]|uniref:Protein DBF4 like protein n=1 Tax=Argiope bruennichi TaxID=94029 RepID=A0A8T0E700_ARGBR|nr:Protein DBF4 like protein [Argiope bruennichi]
MRVDSSLRPFERKTFFLDLHGYPQEASLIKNLKLLGARHEPVFSKYVSFVVSNRVPLKTTAIIHQRPYSPLTPKSTGMCPSPQLFSECSADYLESSPYSISLSPDPYPPSPKVQSRGMALLKKATQKAKENQRATDLLENCKRWGIKVYHVEKILPKVKKYTNLIAAQYAKQKDQKKKDNEKKEEYPSHVKKLLPPFIKFEDKERKFKPIFQEFTSWTEVIDSSLSRNINQLNKQFKRTGDLSDVSRSVFAEININTSNKNLESSRIYSLHADESRTKSFTKLTENLKPSNCTSVQVSTSILPLDTEKENTVQVVKNKKHCRRVKSKSPYCEICHKNYIDLDEHIKTEKHRRFMSNPINFLAVQNIITSLPKKGDDLLYKSYLIEEGNHFSFPGSCQNTEILDCNNVLYQPEIVTDVFDPVFDIHDLPTEPYSFIDPEFVSPSCSSPDLVPLPFLHDSGEECSEKPSSHRNETCNNILDFSMEKNSDFKPEIPPVSSNVAFLQNATANTNNIMCNDITLPNDLTTVDMVDTLAEGNRCQEESVQENQISLNEVTDAPENPDSTEAQVENNSVNVSIHGQRKNKKRAGTEISGSSFKQKRRKVASKRSCNIKKRETDDAIASVPSCNSNDYICKDVSSVQINLLSEVECPVSEEICDSEDSAIVIPSNDIYLKTVPTSQNNTGEISESVSETFQICSELDVTFEKLNSIDSTIKRMNSGSDTESLLHSQIEFISEEICDSQDSAIVVPLKDTHSKILTTFQNISENIPESVSGAFQICSETALAFEMNPNDCKKRRNIEHDLSDSEDLNNNMCHEMFQNSVVDSGIDMLTPFLMNSTLDTSFEKFAERDTNSLINFNNNCSLDASVNNCFSANYYTSNIDHPFQSKDMSSRLEDISTDLCPAEAETSVSCIYEDTLNRKVHFMEDPDLELFKSASQITVCSEQNEKVVSVLINGFNYKDGILNDQLSCAPMLSLLADTAI